MYDTSLSRLAASCLLFLTVFSTVIISPLNVWYLLKDLVVKHIYWFIVSLAYFVRLASEYRIPLFHNFKPASLPYVSAAFFDFVVSVHSSRSSLWKLKCCSIMLDTAY